MKNLDSLFDTTTKVKENQATESITDTVFISPKPKENISKKDRRKTGKRSDPNYTQVTLLITKDSHFQLKTYCLRNSEEISNTIELWVETLIESTNTPDTVPVKSKRRGKRSDSNYRQLSVLLTKDAHKKLKTYCLLYGMEMSDLIERWIKENISEKDPNSKE